ncbi:hypothetical protein VTK73DRAFT_8673 [Phialemonium thermophilum]|uniref:Uncharacterized protein n=1 Tax=Phialemonium thermophilum TaxID=223376 RepID=A0ABR3XP24_9PEZI
MHRDWAALDTMATTELLRIKRDAGQLSASGARYLAEVEENKRLSKERYEMVETFDTGFGTVYCTSGCCVVNPDTGVMLDWGLVKLGSKPFGNFHHLRSTEGSIAAHLQASGGIRTLYGKDGEQDKILAPSVDGLGHVRRTVLKVGRTTGETCGSPNQIQQTLLIVSLEGNTMWGKSPDENPIGFGWGGDSGSLVFDYTGKAIGLYFAGQTKTRDGTPVIPPVDGLHFVSPIADVLTDIQQTLANEPRFDGCEIDVDFIWGGDDDE